MVGILAYNAPNVQFRAQGAAAINTYSDKDISIDALSGLRVAVIGYGSQGRAQSLCLRDSGVAVTVGLRQASASAAKASDDGISVASIEKAASADILVMAAPDEAHGEIWSNHLQGRVRRGATLLFIHGFSIHYRTLEPPPHLDVVMVAPKGPGAALRRAYERGFGLPALLAVHNDGSGHARERALAYAAALGCGRAGIMETDFRQETETDLFGEQAVLCGGMLALMQGAFDTMIEAGYAPELAWLECIYESRLIIDLLCERGLAGMTDAISSAAALGGAEAGARLVDDRSRKVLADILADIQSGTFARHMTEQGGAGHPRLQALRKGRTGSVMDRARADLYKCLPGLAAAEAAPQR